MPWNVRDKETRLLLSRGDVIESEAQLDALLERGAWVDIEEARAATHLHEGVESKPTAVPRAQNLFGMWEQRADEMRKLMARVPQAPYLPRRVAEFADWLIAAAQHHERSDGSSSPNGQTEVADIAVAWRMSGVFRAKISARRLRPALPIQEAAQRMYREDHLGVSSVLIKEFEIYPPGEPVKLASGESGVVMRRTSQVKCPIVAAIIDGVDKSLVARMPPERVYGYASASPTAAAPMKHRPILNPAKYIDSGSEPALPSLRMYIPGIFPNNQGQFTRNKGCADIPSSFRRVIL